MVRINKFSNFIVSLALFEYSVRYSNPSALAGGWLVKITKFLNQNIAPNLY